MKRAVFPGFIGIALIAAGCKKQSSNASMPAPAPTQEQATASTPQPETATAPTEGEAPLHGPGAIVENAQPAVIQNNPNADAVLGQLSLELRKYVLRTKIAPKTFEEFVSQAGVQAPPPPPGKKYAIDSGRVVLKNS